MRIVCIGGGPAGLCAAVAIRRARPRWELTVLERSGEAEVSGFGVVLPEAAVDALSGVDACLGRAISERLWRWRDLRVVDRGQVVRARGLRFAALDRSALLETLRDRCLELGIELRWDQDGDQIEAASHGADLIIGADGASSRLRERYAAALEPAVAWGRNRFIWLGSTLPVEAFTFWLKRSVHGLFCVHAYRYRRDASTFIVECADATWRRAGLDRVSEEASLERLERLFSDELAGHRLFSRRSTWRRFASVRLRRWSAERAVLIGDAAHATHFSIGSGTRMAIDDALALANAFTEEPSLDRALAGYERVRRPHVERLARAARASQCFFERLDAHAVLAPGPLACALLARSGRAPRLVVPDG